MAANACLHGRATRPRITVTLGFISINRLLGRATRPRDGNHAGRRMCPSHALNVSGGGRCCSSRRRCTRLRSVSSPRCSARSAPRGAPPAPWKPPGPCISALRGRGSHTMAEPGVFGRLHLTVDSSSSLTELGDSRGYIEASDSTDGAGDSALYPSIDLEGRGLKSIIASGSTFHQNK